MRLFSSLACARFPILQNDILAIDTESAIPYPRP